YLNNLIVPYSTCFLTLQKHKYPGNFSQSFEQPKLRDNFSQRDPVRD
ncbi:MAG: hypothetical protein ACI85I_000747, partial [Arenicella sp.]